MTSPVKEKAAIFHNLPDTTAGVIHTDFEHGFICVEVMKYDDFVRCGSEAAVKLEGKYRQLGKEYVVEDGDICFFKFNAPFKGKK